MLRRIAISTQSLGGCLTATLLLIAACAHPANTTAPKGSSGPEISSTASGSTGAGAEQDRDNMKINWDAPLPNGLVTTLARSADVGALAFTPRVPKLSIEPSTVEVSDPATTAKADQAIAYIYHFPVGAEFPNDGRVRILEYQATISQADLEEVAANLSTTV